MRIEKTIVQSKYLEMELKKLQRIESIKSGSIIPSSSKIAPFEPYSEEALVRPMKIKPKYHIPI